MRANQFNGQVGLIVGPRGLDATRMGPEEAGLFLPLWELNHPDNCRLVVARRFQDIRDGRPADWQYDRPYEGPIQRQPVPEVMEEPLFTVAEIAVLRDLVSGWRIWRGGPSSPWTMLPDRPVRGEAFKPASEFPVPPQAIASLVVRGFAQIFQSGQQEECRLTDQGRSIVERIR